jgi:hypothetical protein
MAIKLFITFETYINHKGIGILRNRLHCLKELLKNFCGDCLADSVANEAYTADECKMAVSPQQKAVSCFGTRRQNQLFKCKDVTL